MTFDEFKTNIRNWATEHGVYEHSTAQEQALKAVSGIGKLRDGVIKNDTDAIKDSIGDVAVCLVNVAEMSGIGGLTLTEKGGCKSVGAGVSFLSYVICEIACWVAAGLPADLRRGITELSSFAQTCDLNFLACCEAAWLKLKDEAAGGEEV